MDRKSYYRVVFDDLLEKIINEELKVGDKLPSEAELEKQYKFSRTPIRQALHKLEDQGYIYRLQGKGSFVANYKPLEHWTKLTGFKSLYHGEWDKISAKTIESKVIKDQSIIQNLGFKYEKKLNFLRRIRSYEDEPFVYMEHYVTSQIPLEVFDKNSRFVSAVSKIIKDELKQEFSKAVEVIEAVAAPADIANHLNIPVGYPLLKIVRNAYIDNKLVDHNIYYTITEKWKYEVEFTVGSTP